MWWGIWIAALPALGPYGIGMEFVAWLFSPMLITYFLLKISGVPMLEAAMQNKPGWSEYVKRVPMFVPWFPKR
jgi:steroid 5-alpha reductase family enzyme